MIILKVTKNQGFTLYLEDTIFKKPQGVGVGGQIDSPPSRFRVKILKFKPKLNKKYSSKIYCLF